MKPRLPLISIPGKTSVYPLGVIPKPGGTTVPLLRFSERGLDLSSDGREGLAIVGHGEGRRRLVQVSMSAGFSFPCCRVAPSTWRYSCSPSRLPSLRPSWPRTNSTPQYPHPELSPLPPASKTPPSLSSDTSPFPAHPPVGNSPIIPLATVLSKKKINKPCSISTDPWIPPPHQPTSNALQRA
jgi:hypothetical protein